MTRTKKTALEAYDANKAAALALLAEISDYIESLVP